MSRTLTSVKARFDRLDRGAHRTAWGRLPLAPMLWAALMIGSAALTWDASWQLRPEVNQAMSWSALQVLDGQWWRAATATILTRDVFMIGSLLVTTGVYLWLLERLTSALVALTVWVAGAVWGLAGTTLFLVAGDRVGWDLAGATLATSDYGPSAGTAAVAATIVVLMRHRAVTIASVSVLLIGSALHRQVADVEHIISFATVLLLAPVVRKGRRGRGRDDTGQGDPMPPRPRPRRGAS